MPNIRPTPTILLPRLPAGTLVGLDLLSFTSTEQFYGISDLTPGWHFLYTGTTESLSIRCGAWFVVGNISHNSAGGSNDGSTSIIRYNGATIDGPEIRIWKWNKDIEALVPMKSDNDENRLEIMRWKANLGGLRQMGALFSYRTKGLPENTEVDEDSLTDDQPLRKDWVQLTNRITPEILSRILGTPFSDDDDRPSWSVNSASTAARDADNIPGITAEMASEARTKSFGGGQGEGQKEKELQFLPIDLKRTWREGAIGRERTEAAQDKSWALGDLIRRYSPPDNNEETKGEGEILGELQFCFLMILTLMNYSCLEQWKRLLALILTCRTAIRERAPFFRDVLQLLRLQLRHCEDVDGGLFEMDGDYDGNFLRKLLTEFRQSIHQLEGLEVDGAGSLVRPEMNALEQWVRAEYGWELRKDLIMRRGILQLEDGEEVEMEMSGADEDDETGEYAPVIVDTGDGLGEEQETTEVDTPMD